MFVEAVARLVVEGPSSARPVHGAAHFLDAAPEPAHAAAVAVPAPFLGDKMIVIADRRNEIIAAIEVPSGKL
jgi:hypothetical protein